MKLHFSPQCLDPLHRYQLAIIFLFLLGFFLLFPYWLLIQEYRLDHATWQWYYIIPWVILYSWYCLKLRNKIPREEQVKPQKRHLVYWVILGVVVVLLQRQPIDLERLYGVDFAFIVFSLFLADSYWDFRSLLSKK